MAPRLRTEVALAASANMAYEDVMNEFARRFTEAWAHPHPDRLVALLHSDVRLVAPMMPQTRGRAEARAVFARLFELLPDLHAEVHRSADDGEWVFIEFTLVATAAGRPLRWDVVDRFRLVDGLAIERISYFDPLPLAARMALWPKAWPWLLRNRPQRGRSKVVVASAT